MFKITKVNSIQIRSSLIRAFAVHLRNLSGPYIISSANSERSWSACQNTELSRSLLITQDIMVLFPWYNSINKYRIELKKACHQRAVENTYSMCPEKSLIAMYIFQSQAKTFTDCTVKSSVYTVRTANYSKQTARMHVQNLWCLHITSFCDPAYIGQQVRKGYISHRRPVKAEASLRISTVLPEPLLFADM